MSRLPWLLALILLAPACVEESVAPVNLAPVAAVRLAADVVEVLAGDSIPLRAIALSSDGDTLRGRQVTWSSSDTGVVLITPGGLAVGRATGLAVITATIGGVRDSLPVASVALTFRSISVGGRHTCGITVEGVAWCWGSNDWGALGTGDPELAWSARPLRVVGPSAVSELASGLDASCAIGAIGEAWCWGRNSSGQLGDGTTDERSLPTRVSGGIAFTSITRPIGHTCGLAAGGAAYCWGGNSDGQLGDGSKTASLSPIAVSGDHLFARIGTGERALSCGLDGASKAWCWGYDGYGGLGRNVSYGSSVPVAVIGGLIFDAVAGRDKETCGLDGGMVYCWGGDILEGPTLRPLSISLESVVHGGSHACGLTQSGEAWCWGSNYYGELGDGGTGGGSNPPAAVAGGLVFTQLSAGRSTTCGIVTGGDAYCWGYNPAGALGTGNGQNSVTAPALVLGGHQFTNISVGTNFVCGVGAAGTAYCWGINWYGQLGDGSYDTRGLPAPVDGALVFDRVTAGEYHACGLVGGTAYCWGSGSAGALGNGSTSSSPIPAEVGGGFTFTSLWAGYRLTCGLVNGGGAYCWGLNDTGQLGDGTMEDRSLPGAVSGGIAFASLAPGRTAVCGIAVGGMAYCWGDNHSGQLGNGVTIFAAEPVEVEGPQTFATLEVGSTLSCGLTAAGAAYCWPTPGASSNLPQAVPGGHAFSSISVGWDHACGLTSTGRGYCWGANGSGQLGAGDFESSATFVPRAVFGGRSFSSIHAGANSTCAIEVGGLAYCWGRNDRGVLGVSGFDGVSAVPFPVRIRGQS